MGKRLAAGDLDAPVSIRLAVGPSAPLRLEGSSPTMHGDGCALWGRPVREIDSFLNIYRGILPENRVTDAVGGVAGNTHMQVALAFDLQARVSFTLNPTLFLMHAFVA